MINFLENPSRNKTRILWDEGKTSQDVIHNLDEITTESCKFGMKTILESERERKEIETLRLEISISIMNQDQDQEIKT